MPKGPLGYIKWTNIHILGVPEGEKRDKQAERIFEEITFRTNPIFLGLHLQHMEVPRLLVESELQLPAYTTTTATQGIQATCVTTAHGNTGSLTHLVRPRIELGPHGCQLGWLPLSHDRNPQNFPNLMKDINLNKRSCKICRDSRAKQFLNKDCITNQP